MIAVFTIVHREAHFIRKWAQHYRHELGPDAALYVLQHLTSPTDDEPSQGVISQLQAAYDLRVIQVYSGIAYYEAWLATLASRFQRFLFSSHPAVVFTSADQYLVHRAMPLGEYLSVWRRKVGHAVLIPQGYEIVQSQAERPLDVEQPWLKQRHWCTPSADMTRPIIATYPLEYAPKFQRASNVPLKQQPDPDLFLLHAHRIDHALCLERHRQINSQPWNMYERLSGLYRYNLIDDHELLWRWFSSNPDDSGKLAKMQPIPEFLMEKF